MKSKGDDARLRHLFHEALDNNLTSVDFVVGQLNSSELGRAYAACVTVSERITTRFKEIADGQKDSKA